MALKNEYTTTHLAPRVFRFDLRDSSCQRALQHALQRQLAVRWAGSALLVSCTGRCGHSGWHEVQALAGGYTCDCPSRHPCQHIARAWAEISGQWDELTRISRAHGALAAVFWACWQEHGILIARPIRRLHDVYLERIQGAAHANIPHYRRHSFAIEWGYCGSGPADLAWSILLHFYGPAIAEELSYDFKIEVIARIPRDTQAYTIRARDIAAWVAQRLSPSLPPSPSGAGAGASPAPAVLSRKAVPDA